MQFGNRDLIGLVALITISLTAYALAPVRETPGVPSATLILPIFAVGAVMFRALSGRPVHDAKGATERLFQAMKDKAISLAVAAPAMPKSIVGVVDKALAYDKNERWASAGDMRQAVRSAFAEVKAEAERVRLGVEPVPASVNTSRAVSAMIDAIMEPSIVVDVSFGGFEEKSGG